MYRNDISYQEKREISLFEKVMLVNSLILSQYWFLGAILIPEKKFITKVYKLINNWINGNESDSIVETIMKPKERT